MLERADLGLWTPALVRPGIPARPQGPVLTPSSWDFTRTSSLEEHALLGAPPAHPGLDAPAPWYFGVCRLCPAGQRSFRTRCVLKNLLDEMPGSRWCCCCFGPRLSPCALPGFLPKWGRTQWAACGAGPLPSPLPPQQAAGGHQALITKATRVFPKSHLHSLDREAGNRLGTGCFTDRLLPGGAAGKLY